MAVISLTTTKSNVNKNENFTLEAVTDQPNVVFRIPDEVPVVFQNGSKSVEANAAANIAVAIVSVSGSSGIFRIFAEDKWVQIKLS